MPSEWSESAVRISVFFLRLEMFFYFLFYFGPIKALG